jgi:GNAT superfamily N-acetyltransferase
MKLLEKIEFRQCSVSDLFLLTDVALTAYQAHYLYLWSDNGQFYINKCFTTAALKKELNEKDSYFYLIYTDNQPMGFLKFNDRKALDENYSSEDCLELERLYLLPEAQGKGIGKAAVKFTLDRARELKRKTVWLKVMDSSSAVEFYENLGFQKCGTYRLSFPEMLEQYRGMYIMKTNVKPLYAL